MMQVEFVLKEKDSEETKLSLPVPIPDEEKKLT